MAFVRTSADRWQRGRDVGLSIVFADSAGTDGPFTLASANGWRLFGEWAGTLPAEQFAAVRRLADAGEVKGTDALGTQLAKALMLHNPESEAVAHTGAMLRGLVGVGDPGETATVTDGE
jgi:hypothetical protein